MRSNGDVNGYKCLMIIFWTYRDCVLEYQILYALLDGKKDFEMDSKSDDTLICFLTYHFKLSFLENEDVYMYLVVPVVDLKAMLPVREKAIP